MESICAYFIVVIGYLFFTLDSLNSINVCCRRLALLYEIDLEAATGTSSRLAGYQYKYGTLKYDNIFFE